MKKLFKGALALCIWLTCLGPASANVGGDFIGNGGSFSDLNFTEISYEFLEALKRSKGKYRSAGMPQIDTQRLSLLLSELNVVQSYSTLNHGSKDEKNGLNFPAQSTIFYDRVTFDNESKDQKDVFVVHELLPLLGIDDFGFRVSRPLVDVLKSSGFWRVAPQAIQKVHREEVLKTFCNDESRNGLTYGTASKLCNEGKQAYSRHYYFVYCEFVEKTYGDFVPYRGVEYQRWTYLRSYDRSGRPISLDILERDIRQETRYVESSSYGLVIYGLGYRDELSWKAMLSTRSAPASLYQMTFYERAEALRYCRNFLREHNLTDIKYYGAVCRTAMEFNESGPRYYFEVVTQNPLSQ